MQNIEFINQARRLLNENYKANHTAEYNSWMAAQQHSWKQPHVVVPFPPFVVSAALAPFKAKSTAPTEEDVVVKALELYRQFNTVAEPVVKTPVPVEPVVVAPVTAETVVETPAIVEPMIETTVITETVVETPVQAEAVVAEPVQAEPVVETPVTAEPVVETSAPAAIPNYAAAVHKIFQAQETVEIQKPAATVSTAPNFDTIEHALAAVPQPAEELAKLSKQARVLPSLLEKLQSITSKWSNKGEINV